MVVTAVCDGHFGIVNAKLMRLKVLETMHVRLRECPALLTIHSHAMDMPSEILFISIESSTHTSSHLHSKMIKSVAIFGKMDAEHREERRVKEPLHILCATCMLTGIAFNVIF